MKINLRDFREYIIYLVLWLLLFMAPLASMYMRTMNHSYIAFDWIEIFDIWKMYLVYLVIFLVHNFLIAPLFIYQRKKLLYFTTVLFLLASFFIYQVYSRPDRGEMRPKGPRPPEFVQEGKKQNPDEVLFYGPVRSKLQKDSALKGSTHELCQSKKKAYPTWEKEGRRKFQHRPGGWFDPPLLIGQLDVISIFILILLFGMNLGVKLYFKSQNDYKQMQLLEKQNLSQQLEYLKYQINPHFFMNTLNNIHALVDLDSEKAKTTIVELSKMMRYLLYDGNRAYVPVQSEIRFLKNYITLMKLRFTDKVKIKVEIPDEIPDKGIPPLMLITFVENSFKHGVSYQQESIINVEMHFTGNRFSFFCENSKHQESTERPGGVGLANVRKRLDLIYGKDYSLDINDGEDIYTVKLDIPLHKTISI